MILVHVFEVGGGELEVAGEVEARSGNGKRRSGNG